MPLVSLTTRIERQKKLIHDEGFITVAVNGGDIRGKAGSYPNDLDHHLAPITRNNPFGLELSMEDVLFQQGLRWGYCGVPNWKSPPGETDAIARFISQAVASFHSSSA